ncbi:MAG TPA: DUF5666 domain-containing protein [Burkholderiaceae bacterium]|nr:DUF5666 domain-containing protein [Burkholderiaceae bacterium]
MRSTPLRPSHPMPRRHALLSLGALAAAAATPALLTACGGGGDAGAPTGGTATPLAFMHGPIVGLGSIIVGGVRIDDSRARVEDDEDGSTHSRSELRLGMVVEVQASSINDAAATAVAALIRFGAEMKGPVASIDAAAQTIRVLDQTVEIRPETVFDPSATGGFAAIALGQILEIHALFDAATGRYIATRVEREDGANEYRLRGLISRLDTTAKTFAIGDAVINYGEVPAAELPSLGNGQRVRVRLKTAQVNGQWIATRVRSGVRRVDDVSDARVRGLVTAVTSPQAFAVNGIPVDASGAVFEPNAAAVALGAMVEVRGRAAAGTIVASRVKVIDVRSDDFRRVELHGAVSALDTAAKTFMLREIAVNYSRVIEYKDGREADLANGRAVEVKGIWSEDRRVLFAAVIEFE